MRHRNSPLTALVVGAPLVLAGAAAAVAQALPTLTAGAPPTPVTAPVAPTLALTLTAPSEVQIDAMGGAMDAQLLLLQGDSVVTQDSDSGAGVDAQIVSFLAPGTYQVRVVEWRGRAMSARVQAQILPPMTPAAQIAPGAPPTVINTPQGDSPRAASAEATLTIPAAGNFRLDAVSSGDAELMIIQNGAMLVQDSDTGEGTNAQITRQLAPGTYTLRVRDYGNRASAITVTVAPQ
jgi:hypothetical protein